MAETDSDPTRNEPAGDSLPSVLDKAKEAPGLFTKPKESQVWKSIFRHKLDATPRNRALAVAANVFLHLHPARLPRDAVRYCFTWGMGGITFFPGSTIFTASITDRDSADDLNLDGTPNTEAMRVDLTFNAGVVDALIFEVDTLSVDIGNGILFPYYCHGSFIFISEGILKFPVFYLR